MNPAGNLAYDVFVNDPPPQDGVLPNGEPKRFSPMASTLIYGNRDAVLTDPGMTGDQARVLGDWVAARGRNVTDIFISPGFQFHVVDALLTNFHLPQSSLLMLVSAFARREHMLAAYLHAVEERYRFFSYGDCMFLT